MTNHVPLIPASRSGQRSAEAPAPTASEGPRTSARENLAFVSRVRGNARVGRLIAVICLALTLGYLVIVAASLCTGHWLLDAQGRPIANDFVNVYAAGRLTADGHPALAYDWTIHKSMEIRAVGHGFDGYYGWHYPPTFLFVAALLSLLPFLPASLLWLTATAVPYAVAMRSIIGDRSGYLLALGFPAALWNVTAGQNGFLTAALIGGTLLLLERRPLLAGICLGLLSYKPHFGLLFPVALIAAGHWRALAAAAVTILTVLALSWLAFGTETWAAFFASTPKMTEAVLGQGLAEFSRLQSLFGFLRMLGWNEKLAWAAQVIVALACMTTIFVLWRSRVSYDLKAAALSALALIATPYLYIYDLVVLAVAVAFLLRYAMQRGMITAEAAGLIAVAVLLLIYPYVKMQVGLAAALIVAALVAWRATTDHLSALAASPAR
jgi:arabinofuranan 3-O-arabinosyltransferase